MTEAEIRLECLKIATEICKSHNCPYGTDELQAETEKVWRLLYPKTEVFEPLPIAHPFTGLPCSISEYMDAFRKNQ